MKAVSESYQNYDNIASLEGTREGMWGENESLGNRVTLLYSTSPTVFLLSLHINNLLYGSSK